jgi:DNA-binding MarR family transcriptional regulator
MASVKDRLILGIGLEIVHRPRQLQLAANTDEHSVVHVLYSLQKQGLVEFRRKRSADSPGLNLVDIRLTSKGIQKYKELQK